MAVTKFITLCGDFFVDPFFRKKRLSRSPEKQYTMYWLKRNNNICVKQLCGRPFLLKKARPPAPSKGKFSYTKYMAASKRQHLYGAESTDIVSAQSCQKPQQNLNVLPVLTVLTPKRANAILLTEIADKWWSLSQGFYALFIRDCRRLLMGVQPRLWCSCSLISVCGHTVFL